MVDDEFRSNWLRRIFLENWSHLKMPDYNDMNRCDVHASSEEPWQWHNSQSDIWRSNLRPFYIYRLFLLFVDQKVASSLLSLWFFSNRITIISVIHLIHFHFFCSASLSLSLSRENNQKSGDRANLLTWTMSLLFYYLVLLLFAFGHRRWAGPGHNLNLFRFVVEIAAKKRMYSIHKNKISITVVDFSAIDRFPICLFHCLYFFFVFHYFHA